MERITQKDLEYLVKRINEATGNKTATHTKESDGTYTTNVGVYHLDYAYGGVKLVKMVNSGGGTREISRDGYGTKRELYSWMQAFLSGMDCKQ